MASIVRGGSQICFEVIMDGYFLVADILGFGQIVKNLKNDELPSRMDEWIGIVNELCGKYRFSQYQLISDTLFVGLNKNDDDLEKLVDFSKELLEISLEHSLPLRGAITFGNYTWTNNLVYGKAIIDGHVHEQEQDWVGISMTSELGDKLLLKDIGKKLCVGKKVILYTVPLKKNIIQTCLSVLWDVPSYNELGRCMLSKGLSSSDPASQASADVVRKINSTITYKIYCALIDRECLDYGKFHGGADPISIIEQEMQKV